VIAPPVVSKTPMDDELRRHGDYVSRARGLTSKTPAMALGIVRRFLSSRFGDYAIDFATITPNTFGTSSPERVKLRHRLVSCSGLRNQRHALRRLSPSRLFIGLS
jgi:hypothetical protein